MTTQRRSRKSQVDSNDEPAISQNTTLKIGPPRSRTQRYISATRNLAIGLVASYFSKVDRVLQHLYEAAFIQPRYQRDLWKSSTLPWWLNLHTLLLPIASILSLHLLLTFLYLQYLNSSRSSYVPPADNIHLRKDNATASRPNKLDFAHWQKDPVLQKHIPRAALTMILGLGSLTVLAATTSGLNGVGAIFGACFTIFGILSFF